MHLRRRKNPPKRKNKRRVSRVRPIDSRYLTRKRLKRSHVPIDDRNEETHLRHFPSTSVSYAASSLRRIINAESKSRETRLRNSLGHRKLRVLQKMRKRLIKELVRKRSFLREELRKELNTSTLKNEIEVNRVESDCIIIDEPSDIIVVEDDDEIEINEERPTTTATATTTALTPATPIEPPIEIDDTTVDYNDATIEINTPAPSETDAGDNTFLNSGNLRNLHQSTPINNAKSLTLFYEDITPGADTSQAPTYETIRSEEVTYLSEDATMRDDVILIETPTDNATLVNTTPSDDSVVFLNEIIDLDMYDGKEGSSDKHRPADNFIPLDRSKSSSGGSIISSLVEPIKKLRGWEKLLRRKRSAHRPDPVKLFNATEKKKNDSYNVNVYNPNKESPPKTGKRMVLVDGSNVAYGHSLQKEFSVKGLVICLEYFDKLGHEVKAVVPQLRLQRSKSTDPDKLEQLHREGKVIFTPCKNLPGGKSSCSYDDRFILQLAVECDAAVISNDNYRDLINENEGFKKIIENRVIGYTWCNDLFVLPKDPYGRNGPTLTCILNRV